MKKIVVSVLSLLAVACSSDFEGPTIKDTSEESTNNAPVINAKAFSVAEHSQEGTAIGFITASDEDGDKITYTLESEIDLSLNENTGELKVGTTLNLDYETAQNLEFTISAFDGKAITDMDFILTIEDVDETTLLTEDQNELIEYFQHLTFWKGTGNSPVDFNQKWGSAMKLYLDGTISEDFRTTVESVISQYNAITVDGSFNIALVENSFDANATLFFGAKSELENFWPDMYEEVKDGNYDGFAMTPSINSMLTSSRIWVSNPLEVLLKHELGHALGFGHSNKCEDENSFLCSQISADNDFLAVEKDIIRYLYHAEVPAGLTETEIEKVLANLILNGQ